MTLVLRSNLNRPLTAAEVDGNILHLLDLIDAAQAIQEIRESFIVDSGNFSRDKFSAVLMYEPVNPELADVYIDGRLTTNYVVNGQILEINDVKGSFVIGNEVVIKYKYNGV